jgi:hypothetical protein
MLTTRIRRTAIVSASAGLVVTGAMLAGSPVSAATHRAALPAKAKVFTSLTAVSIAPHSTTAFAYGSKSGTTTSSTYGLRRSGGHWSTVKIKGASTVSLAGIAAASPKSAWIAGTDSSSEAGVILRSKGGAFKPMKTHLSGDSLYAIAASSPKHVWVVGTSVSGPIVIGWNGHKWSNGKLPKSAATDSFTGVSVAGKTVYLLGNSSAGSVVARSTGHKFSVKTLHVPTGGSVRAIAASSAKSVWVAGTISGTTHGGLPVSKTLVLHGNGKKWTRVKTASPYATNSIGAISAAGKHAYAVGSGGKATYKKGIDQHALVIAIAGKHGKSQHVSSPGKTSALGSVSASSKGAVAVGTSYNGYLCGPDSGTVVSTALAVGLHGSSWGGESTPHLRRAGASFATSSFAPDVPGC